MNHRKSVKVYLLLLVLTFCHFSSSAQIRLTKRDLDNSVLGNWPFISSPSINDNGTFAGYTINRVADGTIDLYIKSLGPNGYEKKFKDIRSYAFAGNYHLIIITSSKMLQILDLKTNQETSEKNVSSFETFSRQNTDFLLYNKDNDLVLMNLHTKENWRFSNIGAYVKDKSLNTLALVENLPNGKVLSWVDLRTMKRTTISDSMTFENLVIDEKGQQLAFMDNGIIFYCRLGNDKQSLVIGRRAKGLEKTLVVQSIDRFAHDGLKLFIHLKNVSPPIDVNTRNVEIWSFEDDILKSELRKKSVQNSFLSILNIKEDQVIRLQKNNETVSFFDDQNDDFIKIDYLSGSMTERHWNPNARSTYYLYDVSKNQRIAFNTFIMGISPDKKYLLIYDTLSVNFKKVEMATGRISDLTRQINTIPDQSATLREDRKRWTFAGWSYPNEALLYDQYDLWKVNLSNPANLRNLTNGQGKKFNITFRIADENSTSTYRDNQLLLNGFNNVNKQNGFFMAYLHENKSPEKLAMTDHFYNYPGQSTLAGFAPIKANNAHVWLIRRERADSSRNYFTTTNFKVFSALSEFYPEQEYKWIKSELINYTTLDGKKLKAIVYKPENFDSSKKYPVIMNYYEELSQKLNTYIVPELSWSGFINVPWFVSKGYIVCIPDITFNKSQAGDDAVNAVVGAAKTLSKLPYIDSANMAISGQSFGGYETYYIVTHSNYFKAAISSSGRTDLISSTYSPTLGAGDMYANAWSEIGQGRIGYSLWQRPDLYIKNSPIFNADRMQTPLLMLANEKDGVVNVAQGVELFVALRRLQKKAWLLQYANENHTLGEDANKLDYTNKVEQFLGYFLKKQPKPIWMEPNFR